MSTSLELLTFSQIEISKFNVEAHSQKSLVSVLGIPNNNKKGQLLIFKHRFFISYAYARTSKRERMHVRLPYNHFSF